MKKQRNHIARFLIVAAMTMIGCYVGQTAIQNASADSAKKVTPPLPDLRGPEAIRHLEQTGLYNSLSAAVTAARLPGRRWHRDFHCSSARRAQRSWRWPRLHHLLHSQRRQGRELPGQRHRLCAEIHKGRLRERRSQLRFNEALTRSFTSIGPNSESVQAEMPALCAMKVFSTIPHIRMKS